MKNLFKNRYAFILVGNHNIGKSTMMRELLGMGNVQYNSNVLLELDHKNEMVYLSNDQNWNTVVSSRSFYEENDSEYKIESLEKRLSYPQAQFVLVPEWSDSLPTLVNTLSQNNFIITCYSLWNNENEDKCITIDRQDDLLGDINSKQYRDNLKKIKENMYRIIMPISY